MTHEELLATIDWIGNTKNGEAGTATNLGVAVLASLNALRAVVELHTPVLEKLDEPFVVKFCHKCKQIYPCETIEAIKKELK